MKPPFQLSSLRHLILLGFFVSLIPLCLLIWKSNSIQRSTSISSVLFTKNSINTVRIAVEMDNLLVGIERGIRQFLILKSDPLMDLANANLENYSNLIENVCLDNQDHFTDFCSTQQDDLSLLKDIFEIGEQETLDTLLHSLKERQTAMMQILWQYVEISTQQQQKYVDQQQEIVNRWLVVIALATFYLVILISGRIAAPVKQLEEKIKSIGSVGKNTTDTPETFNGPTEFRTIFEKLIWLASRLEQLEALRQSFLRHASHEFKTPLSSIQEGCSILNEELTGPLTEQQKEVLTLLEQSTSRLRNLTEQLLDYNYFLQQQEPNLTRVDPTELLSNICNNHELSLRTRQQKLSIDCSLPTLCTDHTLFTRIVENLLSNAQAYGEQGGKIHIRLRKENACLMLFVGNTGPKISQHHLQHLLEPFYRADVPRHDSLRGSGLGLSIVNDCARLLGGHVELIDDSYFDFTAKVTLPIY